MTERQRTLWERIVQAARAAGTASIVYETDWLGWLPFGQYQWFQCNGKDVGDLPAGWALSDVKALEAAGRLHRTGEWKDPEYSEHEKIFFTIGAPAADVV
ncbi:MAG TPA: hypothetical protein VFJ16_29925 [Longimicrobium sp.]|nr:hypothetical protein [Longimicrobium sp.]